MRIILILWALFIAVILWKDMKILPPNCIKCHNHIWEKPKINIVLSTNIHNKLKKISQTWHMKCWERSTK